MHVTGHRKQIARGHRAHARNGKQPLAGFVPSQLTFEFGFEFDDFVAEWAVAPCRRSSRRTIGRGSA